LRYCRERNFFDACVVLSFGESRPDINLGLWDIHEYQTSQETMASALPVQTNRPGTDTQFGWR
jgi:hypothetical protein